MQAGPAVQTKGNSMIQEIATEGKSRHETIVRAKISWSEAGARTSQRDWIDRELSEIGFSGLTEDEIRNYGIQTRLQLL
jgi:hypothetical protein